MTDYNVNNIPGADAWKEGDTYTFLDGETKEVFRAGEWVYFNQKPTVKQSQIGGTHYTDMVIQPFEYIHKNNLGYLEGTAVKYVSRWRSKGGIQDLEKAVHALQYLIEMERGGA